MHFSYRKWLIWGFCSRLCIGWKKAIYYNPRSNTVFNCIVLKNVNWFSDLALHHPSILTQKLRTYIYCQVGYGVFNSWIQNKLKVLNNKKIFSICLQNLKFSYIQCDFRCWMYDNSTFCKNSEKNFLQFRTFIFQL